VSASISAVGLSKRYAISGAPGGWIDALKDATFEIAEGEAVGLIGRNGAGKSTLLRILSRVTRPSAGHADVFGTVGALLEVGTGFHPELSGRENAYLSGAILGSRSARSPPGSTRSSLSRRSRHSSTRRSNGTQAGCTPALASPSLPTCGLRS
jgi:ABC-type polysaccharide/polyol phosphate transport system ATPase subunit